MATRMLLILMVIAASALWLAPAQAGEPTATPSPEPAGAIGILVVEDKDGDGALDDSDPPLPNRTVIAGCSDALVLLTTDSEGLAYIDNPDCVRVGRDFGWLPTSPPSVRPEHFAGGGGVVFLLHNLGPNVMELHGEAIDVGLPAINPSFDPVAPPFLDAVESCVHAFVEEREALTSATAIVTGSGDRAGCPTPGASFSVVMNGATAGTATFTPATSAEQDFVVGGDSMRLYLQDVDGAIVITGASVLSFDCAVIVPVTTGLVPEGSVRVFALSHEAKTGCGAPGNTVIFRRRGNNLQPTVPWEAGTPEFSPPLELRELIIPVDTGTDPDIVPPETGGAGFK